MESKLTQVNKLIDAGFSADEIRVMIGAAAQTEPASEPAAPAAAPEPEPAPAAEAAQPDPLDAINKRIDDLVAGLEKIAKTGIMPTLENVQPKGVDDVITRFFKED